MERTTKEKILLMLTGGTAVGLVPFVIVRFIQGDWQVGILDAMLVLGFAGLFLLVHTTHKTLLVSIILAILALFGNVISSHLKGPGQIYWLYPTMVVTFYILPARLAISLNTLAMLAVIPAYVGQIDNVTATSIIITFALTNVFAYVFSSQMNKQQELLRRLSIKDSLTGVGNRRALIEELIAHKQSNIRPHKGTTCVILMDLDHFKRINDQYGHLTGDEILKQFTNILEQVTANRGRVFRYGGEEFVVVLTCDQVSECWQMAEKIRQHTELACFIDDIHMTVSLGIAEIDDKESLDDWLNRADKALYRAKRAGRNQTRFSNHESHEPPAAMANTRTTFEAGQKHQLSR